MVTSRERWREVALVAAGVMLGAGLRAGLGATGLGLGATLSANVAGCALAGALARRSPDRWRAFWLTGVAGGLSTLSAVGVEVDGLLDEGRTTLAVGYVGVSIGAGIGAVRLAGGRRC